MKPQRKKIGKILLENKFITEDLLNEALEYQRKTGVGITQYLIAYGYINEDELAKCISEQFRLPYLPISVYKISDRIIKLLPVDIVEKYWLIPLDMFQDTLTVVMSDPFDIEAIEEVEKITGYKVQPFVGTLSDIIKAIENYYHIVIEDKRLKKEKAPPLFIDTKAYKGFERRKSVRLKAKIEIHFPVQKFYKRSITKDVSLGGLLFESDSILPIGSYLILQINLPKEFSPYPIAAVAQVVRVVPLINNKFDIGVRLIKILKEDAQAIIAFARTHEK